MQTPKTPRLWTRALASLLMIQQLLGPLASAQPALEMNPNALVSHLREVNFGAGMHDLEKLFGFFEASPSAELGKGLVLRGTIELAREFHRNHPGQVPSVDRDILYSYLQRRQNPLVNALALAENVATMANVTPENEAALKEYVFQNTFAVDTSKNTFGESSIGRNVILPYNWGRSSDHDVNRATPDALVRDTQAMQVDAAERSGQEHDRGFAHKLVLENEKLFLRSYWMYRGLYQSRISDSDDDVIRAVINRYLSSSEYRELKQVARETRAWLERMMPGSYESQRRANVDALIQRLTQKREQMREMENAESTLSMARVYVNDVLDVANNGYLKIEANYRAANLFLGSENFPQELGVLSGRIRQTRCLPGGEVRLSASGRAAMSRVLERIVRTGGTVAEELNALTEHLRTQRPSRVTGRARGDGCGYDRATFFRNYLLGRLRTLYGSADYETLKQSNDAIRDQLIASDPLLFTDALAVNAADLRFTMIDPYEFFRIRPETIERALTEQQESIAEGISEMKEFYESPASETPRVMARLLKRSPHAAWRLAAANWRYLGSLKRAYQTQQLVDREDAVRRQVYLWAGVTLGVLAIASGVGGAFVAGTAGSWLTIGSTAVGLFASGMSLYGELTFAAQDYRDYQMLRQQILAGISSGDHTRRQEAERLLSSFHWHLGWAAFSGFFTVTEALRLVRSVSTLAQVRQALATLPRATVSGAANATDEELARLMSRQERAANAQAREVEAWVERNSHLTNQQWLDDLVSRNGTARAATVEELLAFSLRQADDVVQREFQHAFQNGSTFQFTLRDRIVQALRVSRADSGVESAGWVTRFLRGFKVVGRPGGASTARILARPQIESIDDVNEFFRAATMAASRGAHPGRSAFGWIRESAYQTLTEAEWRGPLKLWAEEVTQNFNTQEAMTEAFLSNPNLPAPPVELYQAVYGGNFWRDISRLLGRGEDVAKIRILAQQFKLIAVGGFLGYMDYAFADDAYGAVSQEYNQYLISSTEFGGLLSPRELDSVNARKAEERAQLIAFYEWVIESDQATLDRYERRDYPSYVTDEQAESIKVSARDRLMRANAELALLRSSQANEDSWNP